MTNELAPTDALIARIKLVQNIRRVAMAVGIGLIVYGFVTPLTVPLLYARAGVWIFCAVLSIVEALLFGKAGQAAGNAYVNALLYVGIALIPFFRAKF